MIKYLSNASYGLKYWLRKGATFLPIYRNEMKDISFDCRQDQDKALEDLIRYAIKNVPFYSGYGKYLTRGGVFDVNNLPIIHKEDVCKNAESFLSKEFSKGSLICSSTGGTTGVSTNIYSNRQDLIRNSVYTDYLFYLSGIKNYHICSIREHDLKVEESYRIVGNRLMLAPFKVNKESIDFYVGKMKEFNVEILHCYPSSLLVLCKLLEGKEHGLDIKEIVVSSEILSKETIEISHKVFPNAKVVNFYGQTEFVALGYAVDGKTFQFFRNLSYIEFVDTGIKEGNNRIAEIVATNLKKKSMPLIRYAMGDYAVLDDKGCVIDIIGRTSDFLIDKQGNPHPAIITNRPHTMDNVVLVQYYQDTIGKVTYKIIVNDRFKPEEVKAIEEDIYLEFGDSIDFRVEVVDTLEKTKRGKHKKVVQKLDVSKYI
jgi:phenylacetate-CoA ligase